MNYTYDYKKSNKNFQTDNFSEVKKRANILQVIDELTGIQGKRINLNEYRFNPCPLCGHRDSFTAYTKTNTFVCYSADCGEKGDVFTFVGKYQKITDKYEQLKKVASLIGYSLPDRIEADYTKKLYNGIRDMENKNSQFQQALNVSETNIKKCVDYLTGVRRIAKPVVDMLQRNKRLGFSYCQNAETKEWIEWLVFLIYDWDGNERTQNRRSLTGKKEFRLFADSRGGYFYLDKTAVETSKKIYLCESIIDALTIMSIGYSSDKKDFEFCNSVEKKTAIATLTGTNTNCDFNFLKGKTVYLTPDNDGKAGINWARAYYNRLIDAGCKPFIINFNRFKDANEIAVKENFMALEAQLQNNIERRPVWEEEAVERFTEFQKKKNDRMIVNDYNVEYKLVNKNETQNSSGETIVDYTPAGNDAVCSFRILKRQIYKIINPQTGQQLDEVHKIFYSSAKNDFGEATIAADDINKPDVWTRKVGALHNQKLFGYYLSLLNYKNDEVIEVCNINGLNHINGKPVLCDASNTAFPKIGMSTYQNYFFPDTDIQCGRAIFNLVREYWNGNKVIIILNWLLGSFHKSELTFYPHISIEGPARSGKTTIFRFFAKIFDIEIKGADQFETEYQALMALANSFYPIIFDEDNLSSDKSQKYAVDQLKKSYDIVIKQRENDMIHYFVCAPAMLGGQGKLKKFESSMDSKTIVMKIDHSIRKKEIMNLDNWTYKFPIKKWIEKIVNYKDKITKLILEEMVFIHKNIEVKNKDTDIDRTVKNYAVQLANFTMLSDFLKLDALTIKNFRTALLHNLTEHLHDSVTEIAPNEALQILKELAAIMSYDSGRNDDLIGFKLPDAQCPIEQKYIYPDREYTDETTGEIKIKTIEDVIIAVNVAGVMNALENRYKKTFAINTEKTFCSRMLEFKHLILHTKKESDRNISERHSLNGKQLNFVLLSKLNMIDYGIEFPIPDKDRMSRRKFFSYKQTEAFHLAQIKNKAKIQGKADADATKIKKTEERERIRKSKADSLAQAKIKTSQSGNRVKPYLTENNQ